MPTPVSHDTPKTPDWALIEADYRAGVKSLRTMADEHGITEGAIRKRAKRDDWSRDLGAKIKAKTDDLVRKNSVRSAVRGKDAPTEKAVIDANAELQFQVILRHRRDIQAATSLTTKMLAELTDESKKAGKRRADLSKRAPILKQLTEAMRLQQALERQAFGIAEGDGAAPANPLADLLAELGKRRSAVPIAEDA